MKKRALVGIFTALIATFLMSHNAGAVTRLGNLTSFSTNLQTAGGSALTTFSQNTQTFVRFPNGTFYIANGNFSTSVNVYAARKSYVGVYVLAQASDFTTFRPEKINIVPAGGLSQFGTVNDDVSINSYVSQDGNNFHYVTSYILHTVELSSTADYNGQIRVSGSLIQGAYNGAGYDEGSVQWGALFFDGYDEMAAFRSDFESFAAQNHSDLTAIKGYIDGIESKLDTVNANLDGVETKLNTANGHLNTIEENTEDIADDVNAIRGSANTSAQKDAQDMQAYDNMQNTDGLINIGDQSGALSIVGSINSVLGQIESVPTAASCSIIGNLGAVNLGDLNFCQGKENFGAIVTFVATGIFLFISFFIVIRIIRRILRLIAWARSN